MRRAALNSISRGLITLVLLSQGIFAPLGISSLAVLLMIVSLPVLWLAVFFRHSSAAEYRFMRSNLILACIFAFFAVVALFYGGLAYPSYVISIAIYQCFFAACLLLAGAEGVWQSFKIASLINVGFVVVQLVGGITGSRTLVELPFLGVMKSSIEYWGLVPRASGVMTEPAHLSYLLLPPLLVSIIAPHDAPASMRRGRFALLSAYVLTFSLIAYLQLGITLMINGLRRASLKNIVAIVLGIAILGALYESIPFARDRVEGILALTNGGQTNESSVFAVESNALVTAGSLSAAPLFGQGLTSHRRSYDNLIGSLFDFEIDETWQSLNRNDAGSLILLLLSETGTIGLLLYLTFVVCAIIAFFRQRGQIAVLGLAHALTLAVVGFRYGQLASVHIMLNLQMVMYCLAVCGFGRAPLGIAEIHLNPLEHATL
jgi:hypothetical protein